MSIAARVEFLDIAANEPFPGTVSAAWRPQEAFGAYAIEQSVRQINEFADASPVKQRGARAAMDMVLMTGDQADNQQLNETDWVVRLLEGGPVDPNSGTDPSTCPAGLQPTGQTADPELYAGVGFLAKHRGGEIEPEAAAHDAFLWVTETEWRSLRTWYTKGESDVLWRAVRGMQR